MLNLTSDTTDILTCKLEKLSTVYLYEYIKYLIFPI